MKWLESLFTPKHKIVACSFMSDTSNDLGGSTESVDIYRDTCKYS